MQKKCSLPSNLWNKRKPIKVPGEYRTKLTLLCFHAVYADLAEFCAYDAVCATEVDVSRARYRHASARQE